jgi:O-antigen/teichoic acid export membrane protein/4-amino-4-deoxy-L-arabinose transferase-like glycosyltransferase
VTDTDATLTVPRGAGVLDGARRALGAQATALAGQVTAGVGNLGFALAAGRLLAPGEFAMLAAFLAVYLLVHVPSASLGAGAALEPGRADATARNLAGVGLAAAVAVIAFAAPLTGLLNLSLPMVLALAAALPAAGALGLRRGVLYGTERTTQVATSLAVEPAMRLGLGIPLLLLAGPAGGAVAVVVGGWAGLAVAARDARPVPIARPDHAGRLASATTGFTAATFFAFALVANQDLLVANAVLAPTDAGGFAVLSVLGSAVAFATATVPMVLLPAVSRHTGSAPTRLALAITAAFGGAAVLIGAAIPSVLVGTVFGDQHLHVSHLLAPYLLAMALLALARVLAAHHCAAGRGRTVALVVAVAVAAHLLVLLTLARSPGAVVAATLAATSVTTLALVAVPSLDDRSRRTAGGIDTPLVRLRQFFTRPDVALVTAATLVAVVVRLLLTRGLWVDEAISVAQAQMPLGQMLDELRWSDVHPPLHHLVLWVTVRVAGTGELAVRMPSILAGAALVPVLYLLGRDLYGRATGRVAALAGAVAPFLVWYSQEARMYSLFMLAATAAVLGQVRVLQRGAPRDWALYTLATVAMAWSQYFAVLPIAVQQIAFVAVLWQRRRDRATMRPFAAAWLVSLVAIVLLVAPMTSLALDQLGNYLDRRDAIEGLGVTPAGHGPVDTSAAQGELSVYAVVANGIWAMWGYHADDAMAQIAALWPLGMLAALMALGRGRSPGTSLLVALIAVPTLGLFVAGIFKRDLFELRYFAGAVPLALVLAARMTTRIAATTRMRGAVGVVLIATLGIGLIDQQLNGTNPRRYDFDGALTTVNETWEQGDVLLYEPLYLSELVDYYGPEIDSRPISQLTSPSVAAAPAVFVLVTERVINETETAARVGHVLAQLENQGRQVVVRTDHPNVTVWELR